MYAPFGLNEDDYVTRKRSPSIDTEFRGKVYPSCFALRGMIILPYARTPSLSSFFFQNNVGVILIWKK